MGITLLLFMGILLWCFVALGLAIKAAEIIVGGDSLTKGFGFWYFLLAPAFLFGPPALILIATGY